MADFLIESLRGGMNDTDPPIALASDQCVQALNVEFNKSMLGERRLGATGIDLTGAPFASDDTALWIYRHLPTTDEADAQLWVLALTDVATVVLAYKDTTWHTVTMPDALTIDGVSEYRVQGQTLHEKLFIAYNSSVDRLHVWEPGDTALRRTGLAEPAAPTAADSGGAGSLVGTRFYRVRYTVQVAGVTVRRSEPSDVLEFAPDEAHASITVTKPASISEGETHWELEASTDGSNYYVYATTVVATTTVTDTQDYVTGYAQDFDLSEDVGDYTLQRSFIFLAADEDRLLGGASHEDAAHASRVSWTPVLLDPGVGNDERIPLDTNNDKDLDNFEGGGLTGLSGVVDGYVYATKFHHTYRMVRTGQRTKAYDAIKLTDKRGAIEGSLIEAFDAAGNPTLYMLDPDIGPGRIGKSGIQVCGWDISRRWETVNLDATVVARGLYFPEKRQVRWWIAVDGGMTPSTGLVLQTDRTRDTDEGSRKGWAVWTGEQCEVLTACLFSDNIDDDTDRSKVLVPVIGRAGSGMVWRTDTGSADNGTAYSALIVSKPYVHGNMMHQFRAMKGALMAKAATDVEVVITLLRDFGIEESSPITVDLTPEDDEEYVIEPMDNLSMSELRTIQVQFEDAASPAGQWELSMFGLAESQGQK